VEDHDMRIFGISGLILSAVLFVGGCSSASTPGPTGGASPPAGGGSGSSVEIKGRAFNPNTLSVKVGTKVTWTNDDSTAHTVTFDTGGNKSDHLSNGATYFVTFSTAGSFAYHCSIHPDMTATVTVTQ
jgi:plastocyanin